MHVVHLTADLPRHPGPGLAGNLVADAGDVRATSLAVRRSRGSVALRGARDERRTTPHAAMYLSDAAKPLAAVAAAVMGHARRAKGKAGKGKRSGPSPKRRK
jgi:hypothetical protein